MIAELKARLESEVKSRLEMARLGAELFVQVGVRSGILWEIRPTIAKELVEAVRAPGRSISHIYRMHGRMFGSKPCLIWRDRSMTFAEVDRAIDGVASGLERRGVRKGASIALMMRNRMELPILQAAMNRLGGRAVCVPWRSTPAELAYMLERAEVKVMFFETDFADVVNEAVRTLPDFPKSHIFVVGERRAPYASFDDLAAEPPSRLQDFGPAEDAAIVIFTSGTTGKPKAAVRKFPRESTVGWLGVAASAPLRHDDIHLVSCPLYHSTGLGFFTLAQGLGQTAVILDEFKPELFLESVDRYAVSTTAFVPTMIHRIMALPESVLRKYSGRSLRVVFSAGSPLPVPATVAFMDRFGDVVYNVYGATETGITTVASPLDFRKAGATIGRAIPGVSMRVLRDDGTEAPEGEIGELYIKGPMLIDGYHRDEAATEASRKDGWFTVGDLGRRDASGLFFIEGRKRDMVISGGVNVYPVEVEEALESHPDISEAAVIGVPDDEWGERVVACLVLRPGAVRDEEGLKAFCKGRLSGAKIPKQFVFLDEMPRNPTGKAKKNELRERVGRTSRVQIKTAS